MHEGETRIPAGHPAHDQVTAGPGPHRLGGRGWGAPGVLLQVLAQGLHAAPALRPAGLREFLKQDYRGLEELLADWSDLRQALGLKKVPDHSTVQKAAQRLLEKKGS